MAEGLIVFIYCGYRRVGGYPAMAPSFRPLGETFGGWVASFRLQIFDAAGDLGRRGQAVEHEEPADDRT